MKQAFLLLLVLLAGCTSVRRAEVEAAECFIFPHAKRTIRPEFPMTEAERRKAIKEWHRKAGTAWAAGVLYEVLVDPQGRVTKIRTERPYYHDDGDQFWTKTFLRQVQESKFEPDKVSFGYRAFYYPILVDRKTETQNWPTSPD